MRLVLLRAVLMIPLLSGANLASAHTVEELEQMLAKQEYYVEITHRPAPEFSLQDAEGRQIALGDFRGKIVILNFIYGSCKEACPLHTNVIASIQQLLNARGLREHIQFVTITTDPERDTAEVLKAYGSDHGLDPVNWVFLTSGRSDRETTRRLGERYGLRFTRTQDGDFIHAVVTNVIDQNGFLRARFHGLNFNLANLVAYVEGLVTGDYEGAARLLKSREVTREEAQTGSIDQRLQWSTLVLILVWGAIAASAATWWLARSRSSPRKTDLEELR
jgi:protein SCO1/2